MSIHCPPGQFHGKTVRSRQVAGLRLTECFNRPGLTVPEHSHELAFFSLILSGSLTETYGRRIRECRQAVLVFHPAIVVHSASQREAVRCFNIELAPPWLDGVRGYSTVLDEPVDFQGGWLAGLAVRLYQEFQETDGASELAVEGLGLEILAGASRARGDVAERRRPRWLEQARELLTARFTENLTTQEIAAAVGVHPVHLARVFRQYYHCSPGDTIRRLRLEYATQQLCSSDAPLLEIALAAGYCDQSHFTKAFRRHTGISPARFRESFCPR